MAGQMLNELGSIRICVDSYDAGEMRGRVYEACSGEAREFNNVIMLLKQLEDIYDGNDYPQASMKQRSFRSAKAVKKPDSRNDNGVSRDVRPGAVPAVVKGKAATFRVRVLFRQNASWQGSITWLEEGRDESFRSALEMLMLIDSVFDSGQS